MAFTDPYITIKCNSCDFIWVVPLYPVKFSDFVKDNETCYKCHKKDLLIIIKNIEHEAIKTLVNPSWLGIPPQKTYKEQDFLDKKKEFDNKKIVLMLQLS